MEMRGERSRRSTRQRRFRAGKSDDRGAKVTMASGAQAGRSLVLVTWLQSQAIERAVTCDEVLEVLQCASVTAAQPLDAHSARGLIGCL